MSGDGKIRLLQLVHGYPPAIGGVERSVRDMCESLVADHGFEVTVMTTNAFTVANFTDGSMPTIPIEDDERQNGVRVRRFPVRSAASRALRQPQRVAYRLRLPGNDRLRTWFNGPISPRMRAAVREADADVICAAGFPLNHVLYPFRRSPGGPLIVLMPSVHTEDAWGFDRRNLLALTRRAFATVARTEHERDWLVAKGAPGARVRVIGHGIDPDGSTARPGAYRAAHGIDRDDYLIAFIGQHGDHKGIEVLVDGFPRVLERCPSARLVVAGARTAYTDEIECRVASLPAAARERCLIDCDLTEQRKADLLSDCDVLASPSEKEAFGITILEAWALAKPVVVGDSPSQRCVVSDGENGIVVPYGDEAALAAALARIGLDRELGMTLGRAGRARLLARYRAEDVERSHAALLREAARSRAREPRGSGHFVAARMPDRT